MNLQKRLYDDKIWSLKYRPHNISDVIIPEAYKKYFSSIESEKEELTNCIFYGPAGVGKTSIAVILSEKLDRETLYIKGSEETSIEVLRGKLTGFVSTVSFNNKKKLVIVDECDGKGRNNLLQGALKSFIEEFSKSCSFIFITNFINLIDKELLSRLESVEFSFSKDEQKEMKKDFAKIVLAILNKEGYNDYDKKVLSHIINNHYPDMRKCLNTLQFYAKQGRLNDLSVITETKSDIEEYWKLLSEKDFNGICVYVANVNDSNQFFSSIYDTYRTFVEETSIPDLIILLGTYTYKANFVVDSRINLAAFSCEVIQNVKFK